MWRRGPRMRCSRLQACIFWRACGPDGGGVFLHCCFNPAKSTTFKVPVRCVMKTSLIVLGCILSAPAFAARSVEEFKTTAGTLKITTVMHAGFVIEAGGQVVIVDPAQGSWDGIPQADLILITDVHGDHMNPSMIAKVKKASGVVIAPA